MEETLKKILTELQNVNQRIDHLEETNNKSFDKLENRFDNLENRFDKFEKSTNDRFDTLEERLDRLELGQKNILSEMRSSTNHLENTLKEHRLVIDFLQKGAKPEVEIKFKDD